MMSQNTSTPAGGPDAAAGAVQVVRGIPIEAVQAVPYYVGISRNTTGARALSMQLVVLPPGGSCRPHIHVGSESGLYILAGHAETKFGDGLRESVIAGPGDFLFIEPGVPHQGCNLSKTDPVIAIVVRDDANEQEHIKLYLPEGSDGH